MNKFSSIFSQKLTVFSRNEFEKAVKETKAEQHAKGFTSWGVKAVERCPRRCLMGRSKEEEIRLGISPQPGNSQSSSPSPKLMSTFS